MSATMKNFPNEGMPWRPKMVDVLMKGTALLQAQPKEDALRVAIIGSVTTDMIARAVAFGASVEGKEVSVWQAPFGVWRQEILTSDSSLYAYKPDIIIIAITWRDLLETLPLSLSEDEVKACIKVKSAEWRQIWSMLQDNLPRCRIVQHLPGYMPAIFSGIAEERIPASFRSQINFMRVALMEKGSDIFFLDTANLTEDVGAYYAAKLPFAQECIPEYVARFCAVFRQVISRPKKVLVVDLDNTLWGGVIGDDGVEGIALGAGTAKGEAFSAFQSYIRDLAARGVILAICSKNDYEIALTGFKHSGSLLDVVNFAAIECSWDDKANGIQRIAKKLNVGLDTFVFVDDNPVECALVAENLPMVTTICLGKDPAKFIACIDQGYWFTVQNLSAEDFSRSQSYQARAQAQKAIESAVDLEIFLKSLQMVGHCYPAKPTDYERLAQMEGKTNQFNLTTRRYGLTEIQNFSRRDDALVLAISLKDKFGDHGIISSLIGVIDGKCLVIDDWLMSCRVFSRTLEQFVMNYLLHYCRKNNLTTIKGQYIASMKNGVVKDIFEKLGFSQNADNFWILDVADKKDDFITYIS